MCVRVCVLAEEVYLPWTNFNLEVSLSYGPVSLIFYGQPESETDPINPPHGPLEPTELPSKAHDLETCYRTCGNIITQRSLGA